MVVWSIFLFVILAWMWCIHLASLFILGWGQVTPQTSCFENVLKKKKKVRIKVVRRINQHRKVSTFTMSPSDVFQTVISTIPSSFCPHKPASRRCDEPFVWCVMTPAVFQGSLYPFCLFVAMRVYLIIMLQPLLAHRYQTEPAARAARCPFQHWSDAETPAAAADGRSRKAEQMALRASAFPILTLRWREHENKMSHQQDYPSWIQVKHFVLIFCSFIIFFSQHQYNFKVGDLALAWLC